MALSEFQLPIDIANRACQHCGVPRITALTDTSKAAGEINFAFGKLRRAELQRNYWTFAIKKVALRAVDTDTMLLVPSLWSASTIYFVGSIVADSFGNFWISSSPNNLGNQPLTTPTWDPYCGPLSVAKYDSTTSYSAGELVYTTAGDGTNRVYLSLENGNADNPATGTAWDAAATYRKNDVVTYLSVAYMSLIDFNINKTPSAAPAPWVITTTYASGNSVGGSDGYIYTSAINGNLGNDPTLDTGTHWTNTGVLDPWTTVFVGGAGSKKWRQIGGAGFPSGVTLSTLNAVYPIGAGPSSQEGTRNVYKLPGNFLRHAPSDPKAGSTSFLGVPGNLVYDDWLFESGFLISTLSGVIMLRFVADIVDVRLMHDLFCEGLGARIALEVCEPLTQSDAKLARIGQAYNKFMGEARLVDAIEQGWTESPLDDYIACRG